MRARTGLAALPVFIAIPALAQPALYGVRGNGDVLKIDAATGAATLVGNNGIEARGAMMIHGPVIQGTPPQFLEIAGPANQLFRLAPWSGQVLETYTLANLPAGYSIHGATQGYVILGADSPSGIDLFAGIDSGGIVVIGPTGRSDLESLVKGPGEVLFALGTSEGGSLCQINVSTGAATLIGGGGFGDARALGMLADFSLVAAGTNLLAVNAATGATTLIGPTGFSDLRGLAFVRACVADCAGGGPPPQLNVLDFSCFLNRFATGDPYDNCDGSTTPPVLNVLDFVCFLNAFASGCQ